MLNKLERNIASYANVRVNDFSIDIEKIERGVVFLYCAWSTTIVQLRNLLIAMENYEEINLFIFDIDEAGALRFLVKQGLRSDGWGETYWVKNGKVVSFLKKYGERNMEELDNSNKMLL